MNLSEDEERHFQKAEFCYLCDEPLGADRVRDHNHLTGEFRGAAHNECNFKLQYRCDKKNTKFFIPVVFHNLKNYDGHLILKGFKPGQFKKGNISCIPSNMERYIAFTIDNIRFIDSLQFLNESLEKLAANLKPEAFVHTRRHCPMKDKVNLILRKGVFPYEYWDGSEKAEEQQLPPKEAFHSRLTGEDISQEDYEHAQHVWKEFHLSNLGQYHDLYLQTDVTLLADVFENFREVCLQHYKLDPAHYYTSPGLSWDAMLKMTKVELELMQDREMHDVVDKGKSIGSKISYFSCYLNVNCTCSR